MHSICVYWQYIDWGTVICECATSGVVLPEWATIDFFPPPPPRRSPYMCFEQCSTVQHQSATYVQATLMRVFCPSQLKKGEKDMHSHRILQGSLTLASKMMLPNSQHHKKTFSPPLSFLYMCVPYFFALHKCPLSTLHFGTLVINYPSCCIQKQMSQIFF